MALGGMGMGSFIDGLYQTYFGRAADAEGRAFWENSGLSEDQLIAQFSSNPEARQNTVRNLYQNVLGRDADAEGLNYWANSGLDEGAIYDALDSTAEAQRYDVSQMYKDYFGRDADAEGLDYWSANNDDAAIQRAFYENPEGQAYLASQQQNGPYQSWMNPLAPSERTRSDLETMAEIYRQYKGDEYAAGMLANQYTEGRNNPNQMQLNASGQPIYKDGQPLGFGVNQLDAKRQADLMKFAQQYGFDPYSAEGQARFHIWEAENTERGAWRKTQRNDGTAQGWTRGISQHFIRPGKDKLNERLQQAPQFLDWIRNGMSVEDPRFRQWTQPYGPMPTPTDPQFLPDYGGEVYDPNYTPPAYTPGPGSSYQGQTIDPLTGQWMDYGAVNMGMQPVQQPGSTMVSGNLYQANPSGFADGSLGSYNTALNLSPNSAFGTGPPNIGGEPGGGFPNALTNGAFGNSGYSLTPNEPFYVPLTIPGGFGS